MSGAPRASPFGVGLGLGSAKRDDIIGFKRDARAPLNQGRASVGNRAAMNGGSMSGPAGESVWRGVGAGVCEEGRHHRVQARCASATQSRARASVIAPR